MDTDIRFMRRAIQLARSGNGQVSPNPMVGAVITADGRIIGEGFHRRYGEPHAEVNAVASVAEADASLLRRSTLYVTLEPCSHYGKTPPCSKLIIEKRIPRVVVGCRDPFEKVSGRGIRMLQEAGVEVSVGVLEDECAALNKRFMTAHTLQRPYILLKWAESADRFVDRKRNPDETPQQFSTPATLALMHKLRSEYDAVMVGSGTLRLDNPSLTVRHWPGRQPLRVVISRRRFEGLAGRRLFSDGLPTLAFSPSGKSPGLESQATEECAIPDDTRPLESVCRELYKRGVTSLLVEGGPTLIGNFITAGLWDEARVEQSPTALREGVPAPDLPRGATSATRIDGNLVITVTNTERRQRFLL